MEEKKEDSKAQKNDNNQSSEEEKDKHADVKESEEYKQLSDRLLRLAAEFDNYKKRMAKEEEQRSDLYKAEVIRKILPVIDEFEIAIGTLNDQDSSKKGIELIYTNLMDALKSVGLKVVDSDGNYDPYKHEILMAKESNEKPGKIIEVVRKGYMLNNILIRPASVIVAKEEQHSEEAQAEKKK